MKIKFLYHIFFVVSLLIMAACTESDDDSENGNGNNNVPIGALPSAEFNPNNLPDEPYAEDAIRIEALDDQAPFYAIELMSDGHYLLSTVRPYYNASAVHVTARADGSVFICKSRQNNTVKTRGTDSEDGTIALPNDEFYGKFTKIGDKRYLLSNGVEIDLMNLTGSNKEIQYKSKDGWISHVYVNVSEPISEDLTKRSLCRTWNMNSEDGWVYWCNKYVAHWKQTFNNGKVDTYFQKIEDDMFDVTAKDFVDEDDCCYKIIFTSVGTYMCFYLNGDIEVARWNWVNKEKGTLYYDHSMIDDDIEGDGYVTIRFAGNQMRVYEDYTEQEDNLRLVIVSTLTAAN